MRLLRIAPTRTAAPGFLYTTGISHAADVANSKYEPAPSDGSAWLSNVAGVKLVAVDGSTITLSPSEGGLPLTLTAPNVAANGFVAVRQDAGIEAAETERDFRWVACSGNTNDVVAHLDRTDPPAGRCVKGDAS